MTDSIGGTSLTVGVEATGVVVSDDIATLGTVGMLLLGMLIAAGAMALIRNR